MKRLAATFLVLLSVSACGQADEAQGKVEEACDEFAEANWVVAADLAEEAAQLDKETADGFATDLAELVKVAHDKDWGRLRYPEAVAFESRDPFDYVAERCGLSDTEREALFNRLKADISSKY